MQTKVNVFTESFKSAQDYLHQRMTLIKLQVIEKVSSLIASIVAGVLIALLGFFILLSLSIMGGFYFAELTGSNYIGFGIITGIYVVLLLIVFALRKKVIGKSIINSVIKSMLDKTPEHDADSNTKN